MLAKGKPKITVPCFISASIILAVLKSTISLGEIIEFLQVIGFVLIVLGIIFLTAFTSKPDEKLIEK